MKKQSVAPFSYKNPTKRNSTKTMNIDRMTYALMPKTSNKFNFGELIA